ncbi:MAG: CHAT domain-containing protein [Acidobacteriota bacterium]
MAQSFFSARFHIHRLAVRAYFLPLIFCFCLSTPSASRAGQEAQRLEPDRVYTRQISGTDKHDYQIELRADQYANIVVMVEKGAVQLTIFAARSENKEKLLEANGESGAAGVRLPIVAATGGTYRLTVQPSDAKTVAVYRVALTERRPATDVDRERWTAISLFAEAEQLRLRGGLEYLRQSVEKYQASLPHWRAANDKRGEADAYSTVGYVLYSLYDYSAAMSAYKTALPLCGEAYAALPPERKAEATRIEADTLNNIGLIFRIYGENQMALDHYLQALPLLRDVGYRRGEAITLSNIAGIYRALGRLPEAMDYNRESLAIKRSEQDRLSAAMTLNSIALCYTEQKNYGKAIKIYDTALGVFRELGNERWQAIALSSRGDALMLSGQVSAAVKSHQAALPLRKKTGDRRGEAYTLSYLGTTYEAAGDVRQSPAHRQQALALAREIKDKPLEANLLLVMARLEKLDNQLHQALAHIKSALEIIEDARAGIANPELRASYLAPRRRYYEVYVDLLTDLHRRQPDAGYAAAALQISESAHARSLLDLLAEISTDLRQNVDAQLLAREHSLRQQLDALTSERTRLLSGRQTDAAKKNLVELEARIMTTLRDYELAQGRIRQASPQYAQLAQPPLLRLDEIQKQVLTEDTLLLEYLLGEEQSYLFAVTPTTCTVHALPKRAQIEEKVLAATSWFTRRRFESQEEFVARMRRYDFEALPAMRELSRMLLEPVAEHLGRKKLLIVGDGALHYLPFAALPLPENGKQRERVNGAVWMNQKSKIKNQKSQMPLITEHEVASLPSASTLALVRRELAGRNLAAKTVAVLADPVFAAGDARVRTSSAPASPLASLVTRPAGKANPPGIAGRTTMPLQVGPVFARLRYSRQEALAITALLPDDQRLLALDFDASRATVNSGQLQHYRYVHFATHGVMNEKHPALSGLVLSLVDRQGRPQEGFLRLTDIFNLKLPAELAVLSACQTGVGQKLEGEGLLALTRGFMYAGARRVLVSLWDVNDRSTADLMADFYQQLLNNGATPAAALRTAQLAMWQRRQWQSPYFWAGFALQGEPR